MAEKVAHFRNLWIEHKADGRWSKAQGANDELDVFVRYKPRPGVSEVACRARIIYRKGMKPLIEFDANIGLEIHLGVGLHAVKSDVVPPEQMSLPGTEAE